VVSLPRHRRHRRAGHDQRRANAQEPPHCRPARARRHRQPQGVQKLLGHASVQTTGDIYADWDIDQLAATMADVLAEDDETAGSQSFPPSPPQQLPICSGNDDSMETVGIEPTSAIA
jgi:hypothetical protein